MTSSLLFALAAFALITSVTPGPNNLMLMASGINFGFARTLPHIFGVAIGFTVMVAAVGAGMATVLAVVPGLLGVIKWASVAYLLYLSWKIATAPVGPLDGRSGARPLTFLQAAAFQWINPKAWAMIVTAVAAYVPAGHRTTGLIVVTAVFGAVGLPTSGLWALLGTTMRRFLGDPRRLRAFNVVAGLTLVATLYPVVAGH